MVTHCIRAEIRAAGPGDVLTGVLAEERIFLKMMKKDEGTMVCKMAGGVEGTGAAPAL